MSKVASKTVKAKVTKKDVEVAEPIPAPVEVKVEPTPVPVEAEPVVEAPQEQDSMKHKFDKLIEAKQTFLNNFTLTTKQEIQDLRKMQKQHENLLKDALKTKKKSKKDNSNSPPRKPAGFHAPVIVSDEMYKFLEQFGVKHGEPVARTAITTYISNYIKQKDLQNPEHKREILLDDTLLKLFGNSPPLDLRDPRKADSEKIYSILGYQKYLSGHFPPKKVKVEPVA